MKQFSIIVISLSAAFTVSSCSHQSPETAASDASTTWDQSYGGVDKSYDAQLLQLREEIAPKFKNLTFHDETTGSSMDYNLYVPENYQADRSYPLVMFMADASTVGKGAIAPLMQGYGGIIWATQESQAKTPSFVLVPSYRGPDWVVNDDWETSPEVDLTLKVLKSVVSEYSIDEDRIYTTGQSMGGMISFYLNATHPDLFAASLFVGSQWDVDVLSPLAEMSFLYVVSAGDQKASGGMEELGELLSSKGVEFGQTEFSAKLSDAEKNEKVSSLLKNGLPINFIRFSEGTVPPSSNSHGGAEHMYSFDYAYQLEPARDWLLQQSKAD
ncbi:alpha/beta hydrolase-fold protein [Pelagicoccus albus]|uniref:Prolyl oligopeptidase family serine peptidase n=1 Tax=Pelagicoccus albus TaxID=415222 RepID=A0A7X1B5S4_9BACT|nr:alpha/beta hydrolase-fold protein [Pelagicoccus albus]MBC2606132.1 prolyl oligopeptidase family serine peptidase [Pelagicoccus albus]